MPFQAVETASLFPSPLSAAGRSAARSGAPARRSQRAQAEGLGRAASEPGGAARISRFVAKDGKNCRVGRYGMRG